MLMHTSLFPGFCCFTSPIQVKNIKMKYQFYWNEGDWKESCQIFNSHLKLSKLLTQYFPHVSETEQSLWMTEFRRFHSADWSWSWIRIVMWGLYCARIGCFCCTWNLLNLWSHFHTVLICLWLLKSRNSLMLFISHLWSHDQCWLMTRFTCL